MFQNHKIVVYLFHAVNVLVSSCNTFFGLYFSAFIHYCLAKNCIHVNLYSLYLYLYFVHISAY